jgi:GT2 family glycosyltransferase
LPRVTEVFRRNVSVVVLNYNRPETTIECIEALRRAPSPLILETIIVDNGSDTEAVAMLEKLVDHQTRLVAIGANRYFGEGNNIGAEQSRGNYLVFLNNDAFVTPGWIEELTVVMAEDRSVAAVGPKFVYPDGRVQEVGGLILPTGDVTQIGKGAIWDADHYTQPCVVDFCSAA